jgi:two-component system NtrC family sensor kinase
MSSTAAVLAAGVALGLAMGTLLPWLRRSRRSGNDADREPAPPSETLDRLLLEQYVERTRQVLKEASSAQKSMSESLRSKIEESDLLDQVGKRLAHAREVTAVLDEVVRFARRITQPRTVAIYLDEGARLVVARCEGAQPALLGGEATDDIVVEAWQRQHVVPGASRLISAETRALAVPMPQTGVLYVGDAQPGTYPDDRIKQLGVLASHAALAVQAARHYQAEQQLQAQLVQSSKMAAVGQLAAGLAHEINNPLGAVLMNLDLATVEPPPPNRAALLEKARKAAVRASDIIKKLLMYSRPGSTQLATVRLDEVVTDTLDFMRATVEGDGIVIEQQLDAMPPIEGNATALGQIVTNLLLNARDAVLAAGARERRICIRTNVHDDTLRLEVHDYGSGLTPEVRERIFEPFFTTRPVGVGTGLGLTISQQIATQHGGTLRVERDADPTTFVLRLPRHG